VDHHLFLRFLLWHGLPNTGALGTPGRAAGFEEAADQSNDKDQPKEADDPDPYSPCGPAGAGAWRVALLPQRLRISSLEQAVEPGHRASWQPAMSLAVLANEVRRRDFP